jgi:hypothetical protein
MMIRSQFQDWSKSTMEGLKRAEDSIAWTVRTDKHFRSSDRRII